MNVLWWAASLALLMCALLTKEMAVVFAALVGIYAWLYPANSRQSLRAQTRWGADAKHFRTRSLRWHMPYCESTLCCMQPASSIPITD